MNPPKFKRTKWQPLASALQVGGICAAAWLPFCALGSANTNILGSPFTSTPLPDPGPSLLRVLGALGLVLGLFLGGAWLVRNGRFSNFSRSRSARLNVLETRSLGARQALYVVAYGPERFLIGSSPAGINLVSHLPSEPSTETEGSAQPANPSFSHALAQVLRGSNFAPRKIGGGHD